LSKTLITIKSRFMSTWFSKFSPLDECVDNIWAQRNGLRGKGRKLIQVNENHTRAKNQGHLAWEATQWPNQLGKISVPKDMGNGSTQPRREQTIP
jgi:hypothetical protein